jgi:hypothetical protein
MTTEEAILKCFINQYFKHQKRSPGRMAIANEASIALTQAGFLNWTNQRIRKWFRNHKSKYVNSEDAIGSFVLADPQSLQPPLATVTPQQMSQSAGFHSGSFHHPTVTRDASPG